MGCKGGWSGSKGIFEGNIHAKGREYDGVWGLYKEVK
jgi:hypothetical protein